MSYHAFPSLMAVLGSVFDEEDVGDVRNAPTLTLLRAKLVEIRVLMLTRPIVTHECRYLVLRFQPLENVVDGSTRISFRRGTRYCCQKCANLCPSTTKFGLPIVRAGCRPMPSEVNTPIFDYAILVFQP